MLRIFTQLERFLRIDPKAPKSKLMRARAVYMMGLAFIAAQVVNFIAMYYSYEAFTFDHIVSLATSGLVAFTIICLRYYRRLPVYAFVYSLIMVGGTLASALSQNIGINTALIPFFILGVIINGFICGWRATLAFGAFSVLSIWYLWWVSTNYGYTPIFDVEKFSDRNFQRAMQASIATILITIVGGFFSENMHAAFDDLEAGILTAQASDRAKTNFLATMSHELCTPMNGIIGINDVLEKTELNQDQRELTAIIRDSGQDLQAIIGNVLLFSQLEAGRVSLDSAPFNLSRILKEAIKPFAVSAKDKGLIFEARMTPNLPVMLIGDKVRTRQILCALLDNAVKFTDHGAIELLIEGTQDSQGLLAMTITITDTGIGISPEQKERIFDRFTQQDDTIKRRHGGTGLGLTIARGLAEIMGGQLTAQSQPGVGSSFILNLTFETAASHEEESWKRAAE